MSAPEKPGYASNFIAAMIKEGRGPTAALRAYREAGGAIRTQVWYRAFGEVSAALDRAGRVAAAPLGRRPTPDERSQWSTVRRTGYLYQVDVQVRPVGTAEVFTTYTSFRTDRLIPYGEALSAALDPFEDELAEYGEEILGGTISGVYEMVPQ